MFSWTINSRTTLPLKRKATNDPLWDSKHCPKDLLHKALQHPSSKIWAEDPFRQRGVVLPCVYHVMEKQTNLPYVFPIFKGKCGSVCFCSCYCYIWCSGSMWVSVFFPNTSICAKHGGKNFQEHNEATRDFLFVDPSHGSFVNGGILASFLFQICRSSR